MVDLIAGTSTGGIIACALARPQPMPAAEIAELYEEEGPVIFDKTLVKTITSAGGLLDERYDDAGLVATLERHLGGVRLGDATVPLLITAYDVTGRQALLLRSDTDPTSAWSTPRTRPPRRPRTSSPSRWDRAR